MSQSATAVRVLLLAALATGEIFAQTYFVQSSFAQTAEGAGNLAWRRVGQPTIDLHLGQSHLAGVASGPVAAVWYSDASRALNVQTDSGAIFQTADFETWSRMASADSTPARPDPARPAAASRVPESDAKIISAPGDTRRIWALGRNLYQSEDNGVTWTNVTAAGSDSIIGAGQTGVAVDPSDPSTFAVANQFGVWHTHDNGRTWTSLNDKLPNLPVARILSTARNAIRISLTDGRNLQLSDPRSPWTELDGENTDLSEAGEKQRLGALFDADIISYAKSGDYAYAGSKDGRVWVSVDQGQTWGAPQSAGAGAVLHIFVDAEAPRTALASIAGNGAHLARTVDAGAVWDDVTANLSELSVNAAAADLESGTAFAATDSGVYSAHVDLNAFTPVTAWTLVSRSLPAARVLDVALDAPRRQVFVALEGYGLYSAPVALESGALRIANAADFSNRPAAPGSVISVLGGQVSNANSGDLNFPVLASQRDKSELQVPFEAQSPNLSLSVQSNTGRSTLPLTVHPVSPAIFIDRDGAPFLVDADTGLAFDSSTAAHPLTRLQLMMTGLGRVQPDWPTGVPAPAENPPAVIATIQAFLDGTPIEVTQATLAPGYVGYYLVEVQLPAILNAGVAQLAVSADGQSSNQVRLLVEAQ